MKTKSVRKKFGLCLPIATILIGINAFGAVTQSNVKQAVKPVDFFYGYQKTFADEQILRQLQEHLKRIGSSPNGAQLSSLIDQKVAQKVTEPDPISPETALDILCGENPGFGYPALTCSLNPGFDYTAGPGALVFAGEASPAKGSFGERAMVEELKQILAVYQQPMNLKVFKKWLLADIVIYAINHNRIREVSAGGDQIQFEDQLMNDYFFDTLREKSGKRLTTVDKLEFVENGVVAQSGRIVPSNQLQLLVAEYLRFGLVPLEMSAFQSKIGKYTFAIQLLYLQKSTENQSLNKLTGTDITPLGFYATLFDIFVIPRWTIWAELFAFGESNSFRNVEAWKSYLDLEPIHLLPAVRTFLDVDQRPGAIPVTPSSGQIAVSAPPEFPDQSITDFDGILGAIPSVKSAGSFVGFSGLEFDAAFLDRNISPETFPGVALEFTKLEPSDLVLTAQLVVELSDGSSSTYETDFTVPVISSSKFIQLSPDKFHLSFRGQSGSEVYSNQGPIRKLRLFAKRSLNMPMNSGPIKFSLKLQAEPYLSYPR